MQCKIVRHWSGRLTATLAILGAAWLCPAAVAAVDYGAAKFIQAAYERSRGRDMASTVVMSLTERGQTARTRTLVVYRLETTPGRANALLRFTNPVDVKGTALLVVDAPKGSEQYLYLPALDRVRRISADRKGGLFVGSDIYYQDLETRDPSLDSHAFVGAGSVLNTECRIVESIPKDRSTSFYAKWRSCIDPNTLVTLRVDYFETESESPTKQLAVLEVKNISGVWTVIDSIVSNLRTGHQTRMKIEKASYNLGLPARLFTAQALADESIEEEFRP